MCAFIITLQGGLYGRPVGRKTESRRVSLF